MYEDYITTQDEAICHLFLHCCFKDGNFTQEEVNTVASKFVDLQIHKDLNFKEELLHYRSYKENMEDENAFLQYLLKLINPVQNLALYSYCIELCLSDQQLTADEDALLSKLAVQLEVSNEDKHVVDKLTTQRKAVEIEKIF
ncbi:TerB family tellurite resistance protein [Parafilimonas sp.]|uniref:tellurite resistance TerB family protein n=1 Tax=Parafilimonas sp. TaxID=1969739 RepID=UPI0039E5BA48